MLPILVNVSVFLCVVHCWRAAKGVKCECHCVLYIVGVLPSVSNVSASLCVIHCWRASKCVQCGVSMCVIHCWRAAKCVKCECVLMCHILLACCQER